MAFYQRYNLGGQNRHLIRTDCEQFQADLKAIQRRRRRRVGSLRLNWTQTNEEKCNMFKDGCTPLPSEPPPVVSGTKHKNREGPGTEIPI